MIWLPVIKPDEADPNGMILFPNLVYLITKFSGLKDFP